MIGALKCMMVVHLSLSITILLSCTIYVIYWSVVDNIVINYNVDN
jgi:hypothetical protein